LSEKEQAIGDLAEQISILCNGWSERIEYAVRVNGHVEFRVETRKHPPLLVQLKMMTEKLVRPRQEGSSGGKAGTRPPGAFEAAALIDEIWRYAHDVRSEWRHDERLAVRTTVARTLDSVLTLAGMQDVDAVRDVSWHLRKFARQGRVILGHDVPTRAYADSVCGTCGGELRVPVDGAGPVFCAGSPETAPCGTKYTPTDWIALALELEA
jgi:hypothetical protein